MLGVPFTTLEAVLVAALPAQTGSNISSNVMAPGLIFVLAAAAAGGLILLLPGRRETPFRAMGAAALVGVAIIFAAVLARSAAGMNAYFWIFAAIAISAAVRVITHPKPVYSALYFVLTVMASAGLFVLMWAEFMAAALVIIYAGAILVTYVFVIMLASQAAPKGSTPMTAQLAEHDAISREPVAASAVGFALLGVLLFVIFDKSSVISTYKDPFPAAGVGTGGFHFPNSVSESGSITATAKIAPASDAVVFKPVGNTQRLGEYLFNNQLVNLELAGLILTVAMVGAIVIARKRVVGGTALEEDQPERLTAPATPIDDNPHSIPVVGTDNPRQKEYPQT